MCERSLNPQEDAENGTPRDSDQEMYDQDEENMTQEEFEALNKQLDDLNSALDDIEQKNDNIHAQLVVLLESNREIRKQMQESQTEEQPQC